MTLLLAAYSTLLILNVSYPNAGYDQSSPLAAHDEWPAMHHRFPGLRTAAEKGETRADLSKDSREGSEYRPAQQIKRFSSPTIILRGTAPNIGLDTSTLTAFLEGQFLQELAFLQSDFVFDKTYETWEIGLFGCEAWTVGNTYPIAFHVQCAGGSMDEPGHWQHATLGYGPKNKIAEIVKNTLDAIVAEYAVFVRKAKDEM